MQFSTISVIGLGYIGLPTAAMFASKNKQVIGVDVSQKTVDVINRGEIHIVEPQLEDVVRNAVDNGFLSATLTPQSADVFLVAVPTPFKNNNTADLSYIKSASESIASVLKEGDLVILESTSPIGATEQMSAWLAALRPDLSFPQSAGENSDIRIAHCPERVLPGRVMEELVTNDRVIGGMTPKCSKLAVELYKIFVDAECVVTNARTAEMAKLTENSFRDVNIAFANELSMICDELDINVWELISLSNRHPRVNVLQPGPGVGGHCIAVDPWFIVSSAPEQANLIRMAREVNDSKPRWVVEKVKSEMMRYLQLNPEKAIKDITVACYGLAFKADIDDLRESPSLSIVKTLASQHAGNVIAVEPNITITPDSLSGVSLVDMSLAISEADIHLLLVDHKEFKQCEFSSDFIIDTKGVWG
jgi:UDP-N-acetyl-D-mannosaminuronic acid dehydrogenase